MPADYVDYDPNPVTLRVEVFTRCGANEPSFDVVWVRCGRWRHLTGVMLKYVGEYCEYGEYCDARDAWSRYGANAGFT